MTTDLIAFFVLVGGLALIGLAWLASLRPTGGRKPTAVSEGHPRSRNSKPVDPRTRNICKTCGGRKPKTPPKICNCKD